MLTWTLNHAKEAETVDCHSELVDAASKLMSSQDQKGSKIINKPSLICKEKMVVFATWDQELK